MKIKIEEIKKDEVIFKPFKCILTFENALQVKFFLDDFDYLHEALEEEFEDLTKLSSIESAVNIEMRKQGLL